MTVTPPQSRALKMLAGSTLFLDKGYYSIKGIFSGDNPHEKYVEYVDDKFVLYDRKYENVDIDGRLYYKSPAPDSVTKKVIGELVNKGLAEIKIETTTHQRIYACITTYGQKVFSELD